MSYSLEELCGLVGVSIEKARLTQAVVESEGSDDEEQGAGEWTRTELGDTGGLRAEQDQSANEVCDYEDLCLLLSEESSDDEVEDVGHQTAELGARQEATAEREGQREQVPDEQRAVEQGDAANDQGWRDITDGEEGHGHAKKRKNTSAWKKAVQKRKRMEGQAYIGRKKDEGEVMREPRIMGSGCESEQCQKSSKRSCNNISEEDRETVFQYFWQRLSWDERKIYVLGLVDCTEVARRRSEVGSLSKRATTLAYHLKVGSQRMRVCKNMFLSTLGLGDWSVQHWVQEKDLPERKRTVVRNEALECLREFLCELPKLPSHYCRSSSSKLYLEPVFQSMCELHKFYSQHCREKTQTPLSRQVFTKEFHRMNLGLYHPKKDQCDTCCSFKTGNLSEEEYQTHCMKKESARKAKEEDKQRGKDDEKLMVACMDLQALLLCPKLNASAVYYKTKLAVHNFTMYNMVNREGTCYVWHEGEGGLSASEFASCITDYLSLHEYDEYILWSDGCGYQNRNVVLANALLHFATENRKTVTQKYLERGHTQMECDSVHGVIERRLRGREIHVPADYVSTMKNARSKPKPYEVKYIDHAFFSDFSDLKQVKSIRPEVGTGGATVHELRAIRYNTDGTMEFKLFHSDPWSTFPKRDTRQTGAHHSSVKPLHATSLTIKETKYKHLQQLKELLPKDYHGFYDGLKH